MLDNNKNIFDIIGIGIGPFNLGLAALTDSIPQLRCIYFDQGSSFDWHPGIMLCNARLQVPFYADLVTVVNPCSRYSYLNYLKQKGNLFRFAIHENNFITRKEFNNYCNWVTNQLHTLCFNHKVVDLQFDEREALYTVTVHNLRSDEISFYYTTHIVIGIGTVPYIPGFVQQLQSRVCHSGQYLFYKSELLQQKNITLVGSGQSAAEIFYDLLQFRDQLDNLSWFTRSPRFYPMEYSKLSLEMTSPDYIDHFYRLSALKKSEVLKRQDQLYRGINFSLINDIYDALYLKGWEGDNISVRLHTNTELINLKWNEEDLQLEFYHSEMEETFNHQTGAVILATGYCASIPCFLDGIKDNISWNENNAYQVGRNYSIDKNGNSIFVQNAELHSHGFSAPDLGMGPYRNATILNAILGYEYFVLEKSIAFQTFGIKRE